MINYPHAYYLKFFLNKQINCFVWNYRGYGRTQGTPDPRLFQYDAEQVLNFLKMSDIDPRELIILFDDIQKDLRPALNDHIRSMRQNKDLKQLYNTLQI